MLSSDFGGHFSWNRFCFISSKIINFSIFVLNIVLSKHQLLILSIYDFREKSYLKLGPRILDKIDIWKFAWADSEKFCGQKVVIKFWVKIHTYCICVSHNSKMKKWPPKSPERRFFKKLMLKHIVLRGL